MGCEATTSSYGTNLRGVEVVQEPRVLTKPKKKHADGSDDGGNAPRPVGFPLLRGFQCRYTLL